MGSDCFAAIAPRNDVWRLHARSEATAEAGASDFGFDPLTSGCKANIRLGTEFLTREEVVSDRGNQID